MSLVTTRVPPSLAGPQPLHHIFILQEEIIWTIAEIKQESWYIIHYVILPYSLQFWFLSLITKTTVSRIVTLSCSVTKSWLWYLRCGRDRAQITDHRHTLIPAHSTSELSPDQSQSGINKVLCKNISPMWEFSPAWHNLLVTNVIWIRIWQVWQCWMSRHVL